MDRDIRIGDLIKTVPHYRQFQDCLLILNTKYDSFLSEDVYVCLIIYDEMNPENNGKIFEYCLKNHLANYELLQSNQRKN